MTTDEPITRRQQRLIDELRRLEAQRTAVTNRIRDVNAELQRIWPELHRQAVAQVPKDRENTVVISVFNYLQHGYECQVTTNSAGAKLITGNDAVTLPLIDQVILALCIRVGGANLGKLLAVEQVKTLHTNPRSRVHRLARKGLLELRFTPNEVTSE